MVTNITTPQFEIPSEMRVVAQRNIEQARLVFEKYMRMTWDASSTFDARVEKDQVDVQRVRNMPINFVLQNTTMTFEFCQRFVQVKGSAELLRLLNDFIQSQMQILSEQMKDLGLALSRVAMDSMKRSKAVSSGSSGTFERTSLARTLLTASSSIIVLCSRPWPFA